MPRLGGHLILHFFDMKKAPLLDATAVDAWSCSKNLPSISLSYIYNPFREGLTRSKARSPSGAQNAINLKCKNRSKERPPYRGMTPTYFFMSASLLLFHLLAAAVECSQIS